MNTVYFLFAFLFAISQRSLAYYPYGGFGMGGVPMMHAGAGLSRPIAFSNGPILTQITPSIHPVYHTPRLELRNIIRTGNKETAHFSDTSAHHSGFPFRRHH
ncbi:hypothetical protein Y032_0212g2245 [Ancylostoma ceylanicum]|uniref:Uncharacterized protein n=1 Tax=Ancylostoma ceylanicum TaxID=53326 RepID=A0A016SJX1_9BILA|nr:hypothetical protein Y032_0212g2245 [Ancylostoma ceylanicum]